MKLAGQEIVDPVEQAVVEDWKTRYANARESVLLEWLEAKRYDPAKDKDVLREAFTLVDTMRQDLKAKAAAMGRTWKGSDEQDENPRKGGRRP